MTYKIKLPQFEGPFDLLLFFIERDELDIYDIPISKITNDFLEYLQSMQILNIEVASDFILVAATLMRIKARLLIPRKELDEDGQEIDPRQELVERLLEYKRYKSVLDEFKNLEGVRQQQMARGNILEEVHQIAGKYSTEAELTTLSLYKLMRSFEKLMAGMKERKEEMHNVKREKFSIEIERDRLIEGLYDKKERNFETVFEKAESRIHAIFVFLALLELIQQNIMKIRIGGGKNNFWIMKGGLFGKDPGTN